MNTTRQRASSLTNEVRAALAEYIRDGGDLYFGYRLGGSPTVRFAVATDDVDAIPGAHFTRDLGDVLFETLERSREEGPSVMEELFAALFAVYERWRAERTASDPGALSPSQSLSVASRSTASEVKHPTTSRCSDRRRPHHHVRVARCSIGPVAVVGDDGSMLEDGFSTHAAAWRWIDDRSGDGVRDAATHDRVRNAVRER